MVGTIDIVRRKLFGQTGPQPCLSRAHRIYNSVHAMKYVQMYDINECNASIKLYAVSHKTLEKSAPQQMQSNIIPSKFKEPREIRRYLPYLSIRTKAGSIFTMLDSGSQTSLIREDALCKLRQHYIPPNEKCFITTVTGRSGPCRVAYFNLHPPSSKPITLSCVIVESIARVTDYMTKEDLRRLKIAEAEVQTFDLYESQAEVKRISRVDLIVGQPHFWRFISKIDEIEVGVKDPEYYELYKVQTPYGAFVSGSEGDVSLDLLPTDSDLALYNRVKRNVFQSFDKNVFLHNIEKNRMLVSANPIFHMCCS